MYHINIHIYTYERAHIRTDFYKTYNLHYRVFGEYMCTCMIAFIIVVCVSRIDVMHHEER